MDIKVVADLLQRCENAKFLGEVLDSKLVPNSNLASSVLKLMETQNALRVMGQLSLETTCTYAENSKSPVVVAVRL